jgi:uncharacterized protein
VHLFRQWVLKIHSRCNLACDHCYVYEAADQSWRDQPKVMSRETLRATARSIAGYARQHGLATVQVVLHGGEPLLVGFDRLSETIAELRAAIEPVAKLELSMQTNGVRVTERFAELFLAERVRVGISLDGGAAANDRHRRFRNGASSYAAVRRAVDLLSGPRYRPVFGGLLCTVDVANDPVQVFDDLAALHPPMIDLLLPHATWEHPPPASIPGESVYGDWLCAVFDRWFAAPPVVGIRLFQELLNLLLGGASRSEALGLSTPQSLVVETDGSLEQTDALKVAFAGAAATGFNVFDHRLDDVLAAPERFGSAAGVEALSPTCLSCPIVDVCGGGLYPHRYRPGTGFANPSVYCADLARLIGHVDDRLRSFPEARARMAARPAVKVVPDGRISTVASV